MRWLIIILLVILLAVQLYTKQEGKTRRVIFTEAAPKPIGPYSQAILSRNRLYVSGQIGIVPGAGLDSSSIEAETRQCLNNIQSIVEAAGYTLGDVCKTSIFLNDLGNFQAVNKVYAEFFSENPPARETIGVKSLPKNAHVEISAIVN
ncbi:MAG TPA: Rid family detoxifying hydrolase [Bacteroidia bacterium]|nr:Rid family detoxifying hydrolase [Bacteroidia bacterium]